MKDILGQEVAIGDHVVYSKIVKSSHYMRLMVVVGETEKGIRIFPVSNSSPWRKPRETTVFNNFVKIPLNVVEEYLKGK